MYGVSREGVDASNWFPPQIKGIAGIEKKERDDAVAPVDDESHLSGLETLLLSSSNNGLGQTQSSQKPEELLHSTVDADIENLFDTILSELLPDLCLTVIAGGEVLAEMQRKQMNSVPVVPNEVLEELMHPLNVSVPMTQLESEIELVAELKKCNQQKVARIITLALSGTIFYMSLMHYKGDNMSTQLYNDVKHKRIEFLDFTRRSDDKLLYLWDSRQAIVLSLLNDDNTFEARLFIAMTNLYLPFGDAAGTVNQELVLLDILVRMDPYTAIDALVGVIETGEVRLWKHSKEHLRFLNCDFQFPLQRGEAFWIAKRDEFYNERGLYYDESRKIPRDLDISNLNRIYNVDKQFIKNYPRAYGGKGGASKQRENFDKWLLLPGKNISTEEETANIIRLLTRAKSSQDKKAAAAEQKMDADKLNEEKKHKIILREQRPEGEMQPLKQQLR